MIKLLFKYNLNYKAEQAQSPLPPFIYLNLTMLTPCFQKSHLIILSISNYQYCSGVSHLLKAQLFLKWTYCHVLPTFHIPNYGIFIFTLFYSFILLSFAAVLIFLLSFTPP